MGGKSTLPYQQQHPNTLPPRSASCPQPQNKTTQNNQTTHTHKKETTPKKPHHTTTADKPARARQKKQQPPKTKSVSLQNQYIYVYGWGLAAHALVRALANMCLCEQVFVSANICLYEQVFASLIVATSSQNNKHYGDSRNSGGSPRFNSYVKLFVRLCGV